MEHCEPKPLTESSQVAQPPWLLTCRVRLVIMFFFGCISLYSMRVNMSLTMVCMVNYTYIHHTSSVIQYNLTGEDRLNDTYSTMPEDSCSVQGNSTTSDKVDGPFEWTKDTQSLVLASFFWGYTITQLPGGLLAKMVGGKAVFTGSIVVCSVSTLLLPEGAQQHVALVLFLRFVAGLAQGMAWPAMYAMMAYWAPPSERSRLFALPFSGAQLGNILTFPLSGFLCQYGFAGGWGSVFYILGTAGLIWSLLFVWSASDTPQKHPTISIAERKYIQDSLIGSTSVQNKGLRVPWKGIFTSPPVWALIIGCSCFNFITYIFMLTLPLYMKEVLKFDITSNGFLTALPYVGMWIVINGSGVAADLMIKHRILSTTNVRKVFNTLGGIVPAALLIFLGFLDCTQATAAVAIVIAAVSLTGCQYGSGYMVNPVEIAPNHAPVLFSIANTVAALASISAPICVGKLTPNELRSEWQVVFYITAAVSGFGNIVYIIFGTSEVQPWAVDRGDRQNDVNKIDDKEFSNLTGSEKHQNDP